MDEIINDFHDLDQIPVFQTQIDPEMMNTADRLDVLQMNIGRVCNLACKHCHVCAGPNRTEVMSREVMADCNLQENNKCRPLILQVERRR